MKRSILTILIVAICIGVFAPITASLSPTGVIARVRTVSAAPTPTTSTSIESVIEQNTCNLTSLGFGSFSTCLEWFFYFIPYTLGSWAMWGAASILDMVASLTISSNMYTGASFIVVGWRLTRDFSNIFLIFILLFVALSFVLGMEVGHANPKKMLISVILIGIILNFSMFITEVVIDTSNTLALVLYNQIAVVNNTTSNGTTVPTGTGTVGNNISGAVDPISITTGLVTAFQPQQLQSAALWSNLNQTITTKTGWTNLLTPGLGRGLTDIQWAASKVGLANTPTETTTGIPPLTIMAILIAAGVMYWTVAYSFVIASLSFIGRLAGLWIAIIFAPFAFISYIIPSTRTLSGFGWSKWWKSLFSMAFAAPIYFFFLLLITLMAQATIVSGAYTGATGYTLFFTIVVFFLLLIILLNRATKYVKEASGEIATKIIGGAERVLKSGASLAIAGAALGSGAGVVAKVGQKTIGKAGAEMANNKNLQDRAATNWLARQQLRAAKYAEKATFDPRNTDVGKNFTKKTKINLDKYSAISTKDTAGGFAEKDKREAAKMFKVRELLGHNKEKEAEILHDIKTNGTEQDEASAAKGRAEREFAATNATVGRAIQAMTDATTKVSEAQGDMTKATDKVAEAQKYADQAKGTIVEAEMDRQLTEAKTAETTARTTLKNAEANRNTKTAEHAEAKTKETIASRNLKEATEKVATLATDRKSLFKDLDDTRNERWRAYLHDQGTKTGHRTSAEGKVDTNDVLKQTTRNWMQSARRVLGTAASGAVGGTLVGGPVGTGIGVIVGGGIGLSREFANSHENRERADVINLIQKYKDVIDEDKVDSHGNVHKGTGEVLKSGAVKLQSELKGKSAYEEQLHKDHAIHEVVEQLAHHSEHGKEHKTDAHKEDHGEEAHSTGH